MCSTAAFNPMGGYHFTNAYNLMLGDTLPYGMMSQASASLSQQQASFSQQQAPLSQQQASLSQPQAAPQQQGQSPSSQISAAAMYGAAAPMARMQVRVRDPYRVGERDNPEGI